ncbi:hypothetical protein FACS189454_04620 [Planctomycetales bacterium]|nr:hypothetical protein FACS189454_04620 [Planctomycetales bacterium]
MRYALICLISLANVFVCNTGTNVLAEENITESIATAFRGMDDTRMRIRSGICHISGNTTVRDQKSAENITIVFDYDKECYRFDRDPQCRSLRTPEYYYELWNVDQQDAAATRQITAARKQSYRAKPFDIQMLGYFSLVGPYWDETYLPDFRESLFQERPIAYERLPNGLLVVATERKSQNTLVPPLKRKYWIDTNRDYSLIRAEYNEMDTVELSWKKISNTFVPIAFRLTSVQSYSAEWTIQWQAVNEKIPLHYFDPKMLSDAPVPLFSDELGESIRIGDLGKETVNVELEKQKNFGFLRVILISIGSIFIVISLAKILYDWYNKGTKK